MTRPAWDVDFQIDVSDSNVQQNLQILAERLDVGLQDFLQDDLASYLQDRVRYRFGVQGDDASGPWTPLSPATENIRASKGYPPAGPINVRTGDLRNFLLSNRGDTTRMSDIHMLTYPTDPPTPELFEKVRTAQRGKPSPNTPERPVLALGVYDYNRVHEDLARFLMLDLL